jgi:ribonucleoside-diphosphate reductase alpha chain
MKLSKIKKRDGRIVDYDKEKVAEAIFKAAQSVGGEDKKLAKKLAEKVEELVIESEQKIPDVEFIQDCVEKVLIENGHAKTAKAYIIYRYKHKQLREEKKAVIGSITSKKLTVNALTVLKKRYLLKNNEGEVIETPDEMFTRVAKNIAKADKKYNKNADVKKTQQEFHDIMANLDFLPNSPTLMNAGTRIQQLAACFVLPIEDSMEGIFQSLKDAALIHKSGGGTGFSFSRLRPKNSRVSSTKGVASGPVSFLTVYNAATEVIKQGGKRRGANMGVLRVDHPDVLEFINCKEKNDAITNFNLSIGITEEFMNAVEKNETYDLINPSTKEIEGSLNAKTVFDLLVSAAWRNGDPGIIFLDRMNKYNPTPAIGEIESTNPCGEQPLLPYESCNLGSINLGNFVEKGEINWERLNKVTSIAVHFLDNVIDMNKYPLKKIEKMVKANRKIGLGVMGWADMLNQLGIAYNSKEGVELGEKVMSFVQECADQASCKLAKKRGPFPNWAGSIYNKKSKYFKGKHMKIRNSTRTTLAPTGTISMIADASGGIEPIFALSYVKRVMDGQELFYVDKYFKKALEKENLYSEELMKKIINQGSIQNIEAIPDKLKKVFVVAHDISPEYHLKMQAAFQRHTDNAVSKTVNFPNSATIEDVKEVYMQAFKLGCKGVTIYRDGSKDEQVLNLNINLKKEKEDKERKKSDKEEKEKTKNKEKDKCPECGGKMVFQEGCAKCPSCGFSFCSSA